jgi:hypothetical protein
MSVDTNFNLSRASFIRRMLIALAMISSISALSVALAGPSMATTARQQ